MMELVYVYDPLCSWCFGFQPVMAKLRERFADRLRWSAAVGGLDRERFSRIWRSVEVAEETQREFEWCRRMGATGFPSLLLKFGEEVGLMAKGYRPYETIESHLHHLLNNIERVRR